MTIESETLYWWTCDACELSNRSSGYRSGSEKSAQAGLLDHEQNVCAMRVDLGSHMRHTSSLQEGFIAERQYVNSGNGWQLQVLLRDKEGVFAGWHFFDECDKVSA